MSPEQSEMIGKHPLPVALNAIWAEQRESILVVAGEIPADVGDDVRAYLDPENDLQFYDALHLLSVHNQAAFRRVFALTKARRSVGRLAISMG